MAPVNRESVLDFHQGGKVGVRLTKPLKTQNDLCLAYTPGVAHAVKEIAAHPDSVYDYTAKRSLVAVVSDGTAILGLGDLGSAASIPVMEGKAVLFKAFGDVDAWPVPLARCRRDGADTGKTDPQRVIDAVLALAPMYGGINLEDIAAPACFEIEDRLDALLDIPVFHDDQWARRSSRWPANYARLCGAKCRTPRRHEWRRCGGHPHRRHVQSRRRDGSCHVRQPRRDPQRTHGPQRPQTPSRFGHFGAYPAGGVARCARLHWRFGSRLCDDGRRARYGRLPGDLRHVQSRPGNPSRHRGRNFRRQAVCHNHGSLRLPQSDQQRAGFPYLFRGALDVQARTINIEMKVAAAEALAELARGPVPADVQALYPAERLEFGNGYVIPKPFDRRLFVEVSFAVARAAVESGAAPADFDLAALRASLEARNANRA